MSAHNVPQNLFFFSPFFLKFKNRQQLRKEEACCKTHLSSSSIRFRGLCLLLFFHIFYPKSWYTQTLRRDPVGIGNPRIIPAKRFWCQFLGGQDLMRVLSLMDPFFWRQIFSWSFWFMRLSPERFILMSNFGLTVLAAYVSCGSPPSESTRSWWSWRGNTWREGIQVFKVRSIGPGPTISYDKMEF